MQAVITGGAVASVNPVSDLYTYSTLLRIIYNFTTDNFAAWPNWVIFTTPSFLQSNPNAVTAAVDGLLAVYPLYVANPNATINIFLNNFPTLPLIGAEADYKYSMPSQTGAMSLSGFNSMLSCLYQFAIIPENLTATAVLTPGYAPIVA